MKRRGSEKELQFTVQSSAGEETVWGSDSGSRTEMDKRWKVEPSALFLRLDPETLRSPSYIDSDKPLVREDGYGLATTLAYLKLNDIDIFNHLLEQTREIVPTFENLRFKRSRVPQSNGGNLYGDELIFDMKSAPDLTPDAASDGTILALGLLTFTIEFTRRHKAESGYLLFLIDKLFLPGNILFLYL